METSITGEEQSPRESEAFTAGDYAKYPFLPGFEEYVRGFGLSLEEEVAVPVLRRADERLRACLQKKVLEPHSDAVVEALAFLAAGVVVKAVGSPLLMGAFTRIEGLRSKEAFALEQPRLMCHIVNALFGMKLELCDKREEWALPFEFQAPVTSYLKTLSALNLFDNERWKLVSNVVGGGFIYITHSMLVDLFGAQCASLVRLRVGGLRMLERLPHRLEALVNGIRALLPEPKPLPPTQRKFEYAEKLLQHPVTDGRHRIVWLILAPYLMNVKKLGDWEAQAVITDYLHRCGWRDEPLERFVRYHVQRSRRIGLMPPRLDTLAKRDRGLYLLIQEAAAKADASQKGNGEP